MLRFSLRLKGNGAARKGFVIYHKNETVYSDK